MAPRELCTSSDLNRNLLRGNATATRRVLRIRAGAGFTIVELLVVIVVIAVLAAVTIVAYNGIRDRTISSSMQSDLRNGVTAVELDKTVNGAYPSDAESANDGKGLRSSSGNQLDYITGIDSYCLRVVNPASHEAFHVTGTDKTITAGSCGLWTSSIAGSGASGFADGTGAGAQFGSPWGIAIDSAGNAVIADRYNHRIRRVTPAGVVSTIAGSGTASYGNGTAAAAHFNSPRGIAVDASNNIYTADINQRIRKIAPNGDVSLFAGSGAMGHADGAGATASFTWPYRVRVDSANNVWVLEEFGLRKISPAGVVSTPAIAATFTRDSDFVIGEDDTIYVADATRCQVRKITAAGAVSVLAGSTCGPALDGVGSAARFSYLFAIEIDEAGMLYVSHPGIIRTIDPSGTVQTLAGGAGGFRDGDMASAKYGYLTGLAFDQSAALWVMDNTNNRVRRLTQE